MNVVPQPSLPEPEQESKPRPGGRRFYDFDWRRTPKRLLVLVIPALLAWGGYWLGQYRALRDKEQARLEAAFASSQSLTVSHIAQEQAALQERVTGLEHRLDRGDRDVSGLSADMKEMTKAVQNLTIEVRTLRK